MNLMLELTWKKMLITDKKQTHTQKFLSPVSPAAAAAKAAKAAAAKADTDAAIDHTAPRATILLQRQEYLQFIPPQKCWAMCYDSSRILHQKKIT